MTAEATPLYALRTTLFILGISALNFGARTQSHLFHRVASFGNAGLISLGDENAEAADGAGNHALPQKNLVRFGDLYYHVFTISDTDVDIFLHTSADGVTWSSPVQVNDDLNDAIQVAPNLVVYDDGGNTVVVVSWDDRRTGIAQFTTATSTDGGATFAPSVPVSTHGASLYCYGNVAVDAAGILYAVWYIDLGGNIPGTFFSKSADNGSTWSSMQVIATFAQFSEPCHVIARGNGEVLAFYSEDQFNHKNIIALHSSNGGASFTRVDVTNFSTFQSITEYQTSLVDAAGTVHLVFAYGEATGTITNFYHSLSTDWGATWSTPVAVNDVTELFFPWLYHSFQAPSIASPRAGVIYVGWADQRAGQDDWDVYLSRSTDNGLTWDTDLMVNDMPATLGQNQVSIAVESTGPQTENVLVMWADTRLNVGLEEMSSVASARVYPVPSGTSVTFELAHAPITPLLTQLCDARGTIVATRTATGRSTEFQLEVLAPGLYFVRVPELGISMAVVKE